MALDKRMWHEEDDTIQKEIEQLQDDYETYDLANFKGIEEKSNGTPAQSPLDLGRNCPWCAGRLVVKEVTENDHIYLACKSCKRQVFAEDIDQQTEIADKLYRTIPDKMFLKWKAFQTNRNR